MSFPRESIRGALATRVAELVVVVVWDKGGAVFARSLLPAESDAMQLVEAWRQRGFLVEWESVVLRAVVPIDLPAVV